MRFTDDYYTLFGITKKSPNGEIRSAFRRLAHIYHPDHNDNSNDAEVMFRLIHEAYETLRDPVRREQYDSWLTDQRAPSAHDATTTVDHGLTALTARPGTPIGTLEAIFAHLNFLLWEIEDLLMKKNDQKRRRQNLDVLHIKALSKILVFFDRWILYPSGFKDYFYQARRLTEPEPATYFDALFRGLVNGEHSYDAFAGLHDYFYALRRRFDQFLSHVKPADLMRKVNTSEITILEAIFEAQNLALHYLFYIKKHLEGKISVIPKFKSSSPHFNEESGT